MIEPLALGVALLLGLAGGLLFFAALWWTLRRLPRTRHPLRVLAGSLVVRLGMALALFWLVATLWNWIAVLVALGGFVAARLMCMRFWGTGEAPGPGRAARAGEGRSAAAPARDRLRGI